MPTLTHYPRAAEARPAPAPPAARADRVEGAWLTAGVAYAVLVSPFVGGIRGVPTYLGWILIPLLFAYGTGRWGALGLRRPTARTLGVGVACAAAGAATAGAFLLLESRLPVALQFLPAIPALHRDTTGGNLALFLAMIPVAHVVHELFYRGFIQGRIAERMRSPAAGILLGAVLFAWTHVFIFVSDEFRAALAASAGAGAAGTQATLLALAGFVFVESLVGGALFHRTGELIAPVAFRAANLGVLSFVLFSRSGAL